MIELINLYSALLKSAANNPSSPALVDVNKRWTYHDLLMAVDRAADMFWELGVRKDDKIIINLRNSAEFIIAYTALSKIGAVAVPMNFLVSKTDEIHFILADCHAKGIVTQSEFIAPYEEVRKELPAIGFLLSTDSEGGTAKNFWNLINASVFHPEAHNQKITLDDVLTILYTSGTTGHPKGVVLTHGNILSNADASSQVLNISGKDVFLCLLPMFHTFAWTTSAVLPIMLGSKILIVSHIAPPKPWLTKMGKEGVTLMAAVPQVFSVIAKEAKGLKKLFLKYWAFRKMRFCISGAAPLSVATLEHFEKQLNLPLVEGYGLTETSPVASANRLNARKAGSVGLPIAGVKIKIIDDDGNTLPAGSEGEVCIKGPNVTKGYYGNPEATKELFTQDGWLKSGDIGVIDEEGFLFIRDRKKDMIIVKGLKVYSAQIEAVIHEHPAVCEAAVIGIPHEQGEEIIKCFCVPKPEMHVDKSELLCFMKERLDPYKRPREIEIVESLPKNSLQKVLKRTLRQQKIEKLKARRNKSKAAH